MGMIIKSTIAGLTLGAAAFGGVYYGLPAVTPVNGITPSEVERITPSIPKTEDLRDGAMTSAEAHPHPERKAKTEKPESDQKPEHKPKPEKESKKVWIEQYLKSDKSEKADKAQDDDEKGRVYFTIKDKRNAADEPKNDDDTEPKMDEWDAHSAANREAREAYYKLHSGDEAKPSEAKPAKRVEKIMPGGRNSYAGDHSDIVKIVLKEAQSIQSSELRDQAYMNVVGYALERRDFDTALDVLGKIKQPELRETARSNIAIGYARAGQPQAAFNLVDEVELDDFQDVMRLQVIEALVNSRSRAGMTK